MKCPNCQTKMGQVKTPSQNPGYAVIIDQCPKCGGIWCDRFEMYQISNKDALKIDFLDQNLLQKPISLQNKLFCPKDRLPLVAIKDINIPPDSQIKRCRKCEGVWLNRGDLVLYRTHVKKRQDKYAQDYTKDYLRIKNAAKLSDAHKNRLLSQVSTSLMPIPTGILAKYISPEDIHSSYIPTPATAEILKLVPKDKKLAIIKAMADEHYETLEREKRFINSTLNIIMIIARFLLRI